jgi:DNA-binding GntR family transcriptional regulator
MFEALGEIEALCAKLSAQRMSAVERKQLENLHHSSAVALEANDDSEYSDINDRFHTAIHQGSQNDTLSNLAAELWQRLAPFRRSVFFKRLDRMSHSSHEHDDIVKMIVAGDTEGAFAAMNNHVANSSLNAMSYLAEARPGSD